MLKQKILITKFVVINEISKLYDNLIKEYKKDYEREPKDDKTGAWKRKYNPTNFKPFLLN